MDSAPTMTLRNPREPNRGDFEEVLWPTEEGDKLVYARLVKTWVRGLGPCQVLIVKLDPDDDVEHARYWATSRLDDTLEKVVGHAAQRWTIEVLFADFKELMGGDHYQMRSARGIVHFWALGLCLYQFLDELRATHHRVRREHLTLGQARQQIGESHWEGLLDWISDRSEAGAARDDIRQTLQPAMQLQNLQNYWPRIARINTKKIKISENSCHSWQRIDHLANQPRKLPESQKYQRSAAGRVAAWAQ